MGAGFTGLTAAYKLAKRGDIEVFVFEKESSPGGLAVGFKRKNWDWTVEQAYHHLFTSDYFALDLAKELNVEVLFKRPLTASFTRNQIVPLDSPLNFLTFPYLNIFERIRTGLVLGYLRLTPYWQQLEKETAKNWLRKTQGAKAWQELWEPLFIGKFGEYHDKIAMSWFWARIKKRSSSLGYLEGGFQPLAEKLSEAIKNHGGKIYFNSEVTEAKITDIFWELKISNSKAARVPKTKYHSVIATLPMPIFVKAFKQLPKSYVSRLASIEHLHALNLFIELKKPFLPFVRRSPAKRDGGGETYPYWLNINDPSFPFIAVVEHTNFMNKKYYGGTHLLYVGNYLPVNHRFFKMSAKELFDLFKPYLQKINPGYDLELNRLNLESFIAPFAQPIITANYSKIMPGLTTPLTNLFLGNLDSVYPWDRGINYAIELGQKLADLI